MSKRGPKPKFSHVSCTNKECDMYGQVGRNNIIGNGVQNIGETNNNQFNRTSKFHCELGQ